ncbi:MAG TPA: hypothetical protein PKL11_07315 [Anaerolineaceae bacterium]|nr:hypothetical protein [Anaerolineaceae bacterium]HOG79314.1 hypothetical protein [Anaerolineaceae bacterium]
MAFQGFDEEEEGNQFADLLPQEEPPAAPEAEEPEPRQGGGGGNNRTFMLILAGVGGLILLMLIGLGVWYFVLRPQANNAIAQQNELVNATNTAMALNATTTAQANIQYLTLAAIPTATKTPTKTPVVAPTTTLRPSSTPILNPTQQTQTVAAFNTQAAATQTAVVVLGTGTPRVPSPTALGGFGFADEVGLPGLLGLAAVLVIIIVVARKLRSSSR